MTDNSALPLADLQMEIAALRNDVALLKAQAGARQVLGRYMHLCDVPRILPTMEESKRCKAIAALFTPDAIWEGVGGLHGAQFGAKVGRTAIAEHFRVFYEDQTPRQVFNTHYLCTESLTAAPASAEGWWVQFQPWVDAQGASLLRSSRLFVSFLLVDGEWLIAHYRTENLFVAPLPPGWHERLSDKSWLAELVAVG